MALAPGAVLTVTFGAELEVEPVRGRGFLRQSGAGGRVHTAPTRYRDGNDGCVESLGPLAGIRQRIGDAAPRGARAPQQTTEPCRQQWVDEPSARRWGATLRRHARPRCGDGEVTYLRGVAMNNRD